jgi:uncharacterized protein (DUF58 family)
MTAMTDSTLQALRLRYNAALAAHQGCLRALREAGMAGTPVSAALRDNETRARRELEQARERLLAAMTEAITGQPAEAPAPVPSVRVENKPPDAT